MFVSALLYSLVGPIGALVDWYKIEKKKKWIDHTVDLLVTSSFIMLSTILLLFMIPQESVVFGLITLPGTYWILHDITLNKLRNKPLDYLGSGEKSAKIDQLLTKIELETKLTQWDIKVTFLLLLVFVGLIF